MAQYVEVYRKGTKVVKLREILPSNIPRDTFIRDIRKLFNMKKHSIRIV